jgi:hypothetical protein
MTRTLWSILALSGALLAITLLAGCSMFGAWKAIPPPGGCDQCHSVPITNRWSAVIKPVTLSRYDNTLSFQTPESVMPPANQPASSMETRKLEEAACFDCHKEPSPAHRQRKGRFHH